jgi:UDP-N-acetylmuramoylalanine--D-glutamate ligase
MENMDRKATMFEFTSYAFEPEKKRVVFNYKTEFESGAPLFFTETIILPKAVNLKPIPAGQLEKLLQSLHIILGISYYKFYCPPTIKFYNKGEVSPKADATKLRLPYALSKPEADFWNTVYKKGLGEFFYKNKLDPKISPKFPYSNLNRTLHVTGYTLPVAQKCLVGIGGGKDSIVTAELLKDGGFDITALHIETKKSELIETVIEKIGEPELKIQRVLDPQVFQAHQYNGHIPISAIYAFLGIFAATLYDYNYVVVGNEHSSNFGNLNYKGLEINHQWSKSFEFETLFSDYVKNFITQDATYFSLLRPFYEIRIVKMFAKYPKYFPYFSSCNQNFKFSRINADTAQINADSFRANPRKNPRKSAILQSKMLWCGQCAKCVFVFTLLSAFLPKKELVNMFGKNLYQDETLLLLFKDILGFGTLKPFDCVGTFEEAQTALQLAQKKFARDFIVRQIGDKAKYHKEVFATTRENLVPEQFKFLGMEKILIAGMGKEGEVSKKYFKKKYPKLKINIADQKQGSAYLKKQQDFDLAIKTPGIKKELITIPHTTATNIFFSKVKGKNLIIGITGSKGKSTTTSLIYHILKSAGKNTSLLGNIGKPMLEALLKPIPKDQIFVLELSSYQLDDIKFSPDIAVVTNLFPEHMDFHGSLKHYYQAKKNIIKFQTSENYFVHNHKTAAWLKNYQGKPVPFTNQKFESNLLGKHNQSNIGAAVAVVEILQIPQETIKKSVNTFKGLPHRLEFVGEFKGITFYDDAISTTPDSTIMAIKALKNVDTIFLGGQDRGFNFIQLEKTIKQYKIRNAVLFPDSGNNILKNTKGLNILRTHSMEKAVEFAYKHTAKGKVCLLSCASPSYSLWKNFEAKGDQFKFFVKKLGNRK